MDGVMLLIAPGILFLIGFAIYRLVTLLERYSERKKQKEEQRKEQRKEQRQREEQRLKEEQRLREEQEKIARLQPMSARWKKHLFFSEMMGVCIRYIDGRIDHAKNDVAIEKQYGDEFSIGWRDCGLYVHRDRVLFRLDTHTYKPLTQEQAASLVYALYQELYSKYSYLEGEGVIIKYDPRYDPYLYWYPSGWVTFDLAALHPIRYLQDIGI